MIKVVSSCRGGRSHSRWAVDRRYCSPRPGRVEVGRVANLLRKAKLHHRVHIMMRVGRSWPKLLGKALEVERRIICSSKARVNRIKKILGKKRSGLAEEARARLKATQEEMMRTKRRGVDRLVDEYRTACEHTKGCLQRYIDRANE